MNYVYISRIRAWAKLEREEEVRTDEGRESERAEARERYKDICEGVAVVSVGECVRCEGYMGRG